MEHSNCNTKFNEKDELIIEFANEFKTPHFLHCQVVDTYVDGIFSRISGFTNHSYEKVGFVAEVSVMRSVIKKLLLDYEQVITDRFIGDLDDCARQIPDYSRLNSASIPS